MSRLSDPTSRRTPAAPRRRARVAAALALVAAFAAAGPAARPALAQPMAPSAQGAQPLAPAKVVERVGIDQNLGDFVPLDLAFRDEQGRTVKLHDYFAKGKPVIIALVYYGCPGLCGMTLSGMSRSFKPLEFTPGKEFEVLTVSFDPTEGPALAAEKKATYLQEYGREQAADGWHFLTGDKPSIDALCKAVGFRYVYDEQTSQFAHATALMLATPQGKLSRYFYGLEYSPRDLRLGIVEASNERVGSVTDTVTLLCFKYDPHTGKYSFAILQTLKYAAGSLAVVLGSFLVLMFFRERRLTRAVAAAERAGAEPPDMQNLTSGSQESTRGDRGFPADPADHTKQ
jgi:protein SCO1/2